MVSAAAYLPRTRKVPVAFSNTMVNLAGAAAHCKTRLSSHCQSRRRSAQERCDGWLISNFVAPSSRVSGTRVRCVAYLRAQRRPFFVIGLKILNFKDLCVLQRRGQQTVEVLAGHRLEKRGTQPLDSVDKRTTQQQTCLVEEVPLSSESMASRRRLSNAPGALHAAVEESRPQCVDGLYKISSMVESDSPRSDKENAQPPGDGASRCGLFVDVDRLEGFQLG